MPAVRVEIPADIHAVKALSLTAAKQWRLSTRRVFTGYLKRGYKVRTFYRDSKSGRCFYELNKEDPA